MELLHAYSSVVTAIGVLAVLLLGQILVVDVLGIRAKHVPGSQVPTDHDNPLFRASRVVGNTNEGIALFILAVLFCVFSGASPSLTSYAVWTYVVARFLFALCYYFNQQTLRSTMFGASLLAMIALVLIGFFG